MNELLLVIGPALIALLCSLVTVYVTMWLHRRVTRREISKPFMRDRQAAYKALWDNLERVHTLFRTEGVTLDKYDDAFRGVNIFMVENALYLDDDEQEAVNLYLIDLRRLREILNKYDGLIPQLFHECGITAAIDTRAIQKFHAEEQQAVEDLEKARRQILEKCRFVLTGNLPIGLIV